MHAPARFLPAALLLPALLASCTFQPVFPRTAQTKHLDLDGPPPDVVIFSVSGRCGPPCRAPRDNWDYLSARGTVDALANTFTGQGLSVQVAGYADNALSTFYPVKVSSPQHGYAALDNDFMTMKTKWMNRADAPYVVLLGHSHGAVWTHHLVHSNPGVPVALQIDLDGICASWALDHSKDLEKHPVDRPGEPRAVEACNFLPLKNLQVRDKDLVWPNVTYNLVVQSKKAPAAASPSGGLFFNYLFEMTPHVRPDGSSSGIEHYRSVREDHSAVAYPNSEAMKWVLSRTGEIAAGWKVQDERMGR